jgi:putative membrane protein insertion efficiency factor
MLSIKIIVLKIIKFYQLFVSPNLNQRCRFYPSCSEYNYQAISRYGIIKGGGKGLKRILRCGPWSQGGVDIP